MRMYIIIIHFIVKKITLLLFCSIAMLACKNPQKERLKELQDAAHVWNIYNTNLAVVQTSLFYSSEALRAQLPDFCAYNIKRMDSFDRLTFLNDTTSKLSKKYAKSMKVYLSLLQSGYNWEHPNVQEALMHTSHDMDTLMVFAIKRYSIDRFTPLRKANYFKAIDKKQYRKKENEQKLIDLQQVSDWRKAASQLREIAEKETGANQKAVAWLDYADLCVNNCDQWENGEDTIVISIYRQLACLGDFHFYKFEAWRKWRCLYQIFNFGYGKDDFIFNKHYDNMRFVVVQSIGKYLETAPMDSIAINQYLALATHGPILRYSSTREGNQAWSEMDELFDIQFADDEEEKKEEPMPLSKERRTKHSAENTSKK